MGMSIQQKEQLIVGTILSCNKEITKLYEQMPQNNQLKNLMEKNNLYHYNMGELFSEINPLFENDNSVVDNFVHIKNNRNNFFAYFKEVFKFLDGYEPKLQKSLNENLNIEDKDSEKLDIFSFKEDLRKLINELSTKNDTDNIDDKITKIKLFANKPVLIYGFDICNNLGLRKELFINFKITADDIISICFDKSNKQLLFVTDSLVNLIVYNVKEDKLSRYNEINEDKINESKSLQPDNYLSVLKEEIHNNIIEVYINTEKFSFDFNDNLYSDNKRFQEQEKMKQLSSVIKK